MKIKLFLFISPLLLKAGFAQNNPNTIITQFNTGTSFSCIAVDTSHKVWAGTNKKGLFLFNKYGNQFSGNFELVNTTPASGTIYDVSKFIIQTLAADKLNNLWVGHAGNGGVATTFGGIEVFNTNTQSHVKHIQAETDAECRTKYEKFDGLATYNTQSIAIDDYNTVWSAHDYTRFLGGTPDEAITPGSLSYKRINQSLFTAKSTWQDFLDGKEAPELPLPAFTCLAKTRTEDMEGVAGSRTCKSVACGKSEVWVSVYAYKYATSRGFKRIDLTTSSGNYALTTANSPAKIVVYDLNGGFKKQITFETVGVTGYGVFNAICITKDENAWVGLSPRLGFAARINGCWTVMNSENLPGVFLADANVNANAIWSNKKGEVFIGTTKGLIVFNGVGKIDDPTSYNLYTTATSNISSDNILGGANDRDTVQWVATDNGINRIKSTVNFSLGEDYTFCDDAHVNAIEKQLKTDLSDRGDWHSYVVETVICDKTGPNDTKCTAQAVYNLMKSDVSLQAVSPKTFSHDNLKTDLLFLLTDEEKKSVIANVNAWQEDGSGNEFGGIKNIRQVLTNEMILKYYCISTSVINPLACFDDGRFPFHDMINVESQEYYEAEQKKYNAPNVASCKDHVYRLYNSPNHIVDRIVFQKTLGAVFCGKKLDNPEYDLVKIYADDKNLTLTNYTMEGHFLDPGKVKRFVVEECDKVKVITIGTGLNYCAEQEMPDVITNTQKLYYNLVCGPIYGYIVGNTITHVEKQVFKWIAKKQAMANGNGNIILGSILFKNVDLLLKQKFASGN